MTIYLPDLPQETLKASPHFLLHFHFILRDIIFEHYRLMYVILFKKSGNVLDSNPNDFESPPKYNPGEFSHLV